LAHIRVNVLYILQQNGYSEAAFAAKQRCGEAANTLSLLSLLSPV
jgi:hypothetical protein